MKADELQSLADRLIQGGQITQAEALQIAQIPESEIHDLLAAANRVTRHYKANQVHTCTILNGKSGKCSEDCGFCSQSQSATTDAPFYPLMSDEEIQEAAHAAMRSGVDRFSIVTAGRGLPKEQVARVAQAFKAMPAPGGNQGAIAQGQTRWCASLGILKKEELQVLFDGGISRFHHNLETARSHFPQICQSHEYDERIHTIKAAKAVGMSTCVGGIFGLGESDAQAAEFALELRSLEVDSVPMNFLIPVAGTRMEGAPRISPMRCLKLIALFRMILPTQDILVCGGREDNLKEWHPMVLQAGANGIMTGNYLTREGRTLSKDKAMLDAFQYQHGLKDF